MISVYVIQYNYTCCIFLVVPCPEIIESPINNTVFLGQTANYYCLALSFGLLSYEWKKSNNDSLHPNAVQTYIHKDILGGVTIVPSLKIPTVQQSDEGEYCCVATNECGSVTKCAWLTVISK